MLVQKYSEQRKYLVYIVPSKFKYFLIKLFLYDTFNNYFCVVSRIHYIDSTIADMTLTALPKNLTRRLSSRVRNNQHIQLS